MATNWFFSRSYLHKCPDGTVKLVYKNIDKAFPLSVKELFNKLKADLKVAEEASVKLNNDYSSKIKGLLYHVSDSNESLILLFRTVYLGYQSDPCSSQGFLIRQIERIAEQQNRFREIKSQIDGLMALADLYPKNPEKIFPLYETLINKLGMVDSVEVSKKEIKENVSNAVKWIGGDNNG